MYFGGGKGIEKNVVNCPSCDKPKPDPCSVVKGWGGFEPLPRKDSRLVKVATQNCDDGNLYPPTHHCFVRKIAKLEAPKIPQLVRWRWRFMCEPDRCNDNYLTAVVSKVRGGIARATI